MRHPRQTSYNIRHNYSGCVYSHKPMSSILMPAQYPRRFDSVFNDSVISRLICHCRQHVKILTIDHNSYQQFISQRHTFQRILPIGTKFTNLPVLLLKYSAIAPAKEDRLGVLITLKRIIINPRRFEISLPLTEIGIARMLTLCTYEDEMHSSALRSRC